MIIRVFGKIFPPQTRRELRQLGYHLGWFSQALCRRDLRSAWNVAQVGFGRALADLRGILGTGDKVSCEICGWSGHDFYPFTDQGMGLWRNHLCPSCSSLPRHRLLWRYLKEILGVGARPLSLLEIGPWQGLCRSLAALPNTRYIAVDKQSLPGCLVADAAKLPFPEDAFDIVLCLNVLNGVEDDIAVVSEILRVCKRGGAILLSEPMDFQQETTAHFNSPNAKKHGALRWYGRDFPRYFSQTGLVLKEEDYATHLPSEIVKRHGLNRQIFFVGSKT